MIIFFQYIIFFFFLAVIGILYLYIHTYILTCFVFELKKRRTNLTWLLIPLSPSNFYSATVGQPINRYQITFCFSHLFIFYIIIPALKMFSIGSWNGSR